MAVAIDACSATPFLSDSTHLLFMVTNCNQHCNLFILMSLNSLTKTWVGMSVYGRLFYKTK